MLEEFNIVELNKRTSDLRLQRQQNQDNIKKLREEIKAIEELIKKPRDKDENQFVTSVDRADIKSTEATIAQKEKELKDLTKIKFQSSVSYSNILKELISAKNKRNKASKSYQIHDDPMLSDNSAMTDHRKLISSIPPKIKN